MLMRADANPNIASERAGDDYDGCTAIFYAVEFQCHAVILEMLIRMGALLNVHDTKGCTVLCRALDQRHFAKRKLRATIR